MFSFRRDKMGFFNALILIIIVIVLLLVVVIVIMLLIGSLLKQIHIERMLLRGLQTGSTPGDGLLERVC